MIRNRFIFLLLIVCIIFVLSACEQTEGPLEDDADLKDDVLVPVDRMLVPKQCEYLENLDGWQPVYCDDFDYEGLPDSETWMYDSGDYSKQFELQFYTREDLRNAYVEDGLLHIVANHHKLYPTNDYTSARLITKYYGEWTYCRILIRAILPSGLGTWPAFWMLPASAKYGQWPHSGEIDIMEHVGYDEGPVYATIHSTAQHELGLRNYSLNLEDATSAFHVYEMVWEPRQFIFLIDGQEYARYDYMPEVYVGYDPISAWPFDQDFYLIMNLAVGGVWGNNMGVDPEDFPADMVIDYVHVYQKDYAASDQRPPDPVDTLEILYNYENRIQIAWANPEDDVMVKEYQVYLNGVLVDTVSINSYLFEELEEGSYRVEIVAVDFAGNTSEPTLLAFTLDR